MEIKLLEQELLTEENKRLKNENKKLKDKEEKFMNKFESVIIMKPTLSAEEREKELNEYKKFLEGLSNELVTIEDIGIKKLAYEIQKNKEGDYAIFNFYGKTEDVYDLERKYKLDDNVIKFITVKQEQEQEIEDTEGMEDEDMEM